MNYQGSSYRNEITEVSRRRDTRRSGQRLADFLKTPTGTIVGLVCFIMLALVTYKVPFAGELLLLLLGLLGVLFFRTDNRAFDMPFRVPQQAKLRDGSTRGGKGMGSGITYLGNDGETGAQIYVNNSDLRTHQIVLGTTGSGKTEYLMGIMCNALAQNTGFIMIDGKGDAKTQKDIFRLARTYGREDDLLVINFMTSGRDFIGKQPDKVTNNMNIMGNTSSGMLIELIVSLMDDSGASGDMWKGRAISFVAALTRVLVYLRDKGFIMLSPEKFIEYFEMSAIQSLIYGHQGKYGHQFDVICDSLKSYLITLPGYVKPTNGEIKPQGSKTLEQHGFIVMQLTRIFNDLNFNYGHIFKTRVGDVDFFDVVLNRRILCVLLPALERAPDTMKMLGKMIVGAVKQMMAGCLGNRVEGVVREIIDSRPTNAAVPYYLIFDEYGYYAVLGFAVAPAQGRSLGFCITFGAQDFESLKKSSTEEANATWENTNIRVIGRLTSGMEKSETWEKVRGAAGESLEAVYSSYERDSAALLNPLRRGDHLTIERRSRLNYDDLASQEAGEFTFILGKKRNEGRSGSVQVVRGMGFYTGGPDPREIRLNDLLPVEVPEDEDLPRNIEALDFIAQALEDDSLDKALSEHVKPCQELTRLSNLFDRFEPTVKKIDHRFDAVKAVLITAFDQIQAEAKEGETKTSESKPVQKPVQPEAAPSASAPTADAAKEASASSTVQGQVSAKSDTNQTADGQAVSTPTAQPIGQTEQSDLKHDAKQTVSDEAKSVLFKISQKKVDKPEEKPTEWAKDDEVLSMKQDEEGNEGNGPRYQTDLIISDAERASLKRRKAKALGLFRYRRPPQDAQLTAADIDVMPGDIANAEQLVSIERSSPETTSIRDHWEDQDKARSIKKTIAEQTTYIDPPVPKKLSFKESEAALKSLGEKCELLMKNRFGQE